MVAPYVSWDPRVSPHGPSGSLSKRRANTHGGVLGLRGVHWDSSRCVGRPGVSIEPVRTGIVLSKSNADGTTAMRAMSVTYGAEILFAGPEGIAG